MKVVVVDDSAADRNFYRMLLEQAYGQMEEEAEMIAASASRTRRVAGAGFAGSLSWFSGGVAPKPQQARISKSAAVLEYHQAETGAKGLEMCRALAPDCVLLDYKLPDMTGMEFLARLGAESPAEFAPGVPAYAVVMLTGLASERIAVGALQAGAQDYLLKDRITAESLSLALDKATGKVSLIRALKSERDRLAASLAEKEVLLKEVHHRVKNNLQVIVSLLRLQNDVIHDGRLNEALRESQLRVESMALIHEQLYETTDLREVDLARHASLLVSKLFNSYGVKTSRIIYEEQIEPLPLAVDHAIPAGLILNELISNALKHAFPGERGGTITIRGGREGSQIFLEVLDDGIGIPPAIDILHPRSLGLEIVNILARQLRGSVTHRALTRARAAGEGTVLRITFPAPAPTEVR